MLKLIHLLTLSSALALSTSNTPPANAADEGRQASDTVVRDERAPDTPSYQPPARGAVSTRVAGGTRDLDTHAATLTALAPDHVGLTTRAQPTLYWYFAESVDHPVEVTVVDDQKVEPLLRIRLQGPVEAGLHALDLAKHDVELEQGRAYDWSVTVILDPDRRSADVASSASIERVEPSTELRSSLSQNESLSRSGIYAREGIWYDALDSLTRQIDASAAADGELVKHLRRHRGTLLEQVGLTMLAAYDENTI